MKILPPAQELPDELQRRLALAREQVVVESVPLRFGYMMSILSLFGPKWRMKDADQKREVLEEKGGEVALAPVRGWQRRAWNAMLCLEKVAPLWNAQTLPLHHFEDKDLYKDEEERTVLVGLDLPREIQKMKSDILNVSPRHWLHSPPIADDVTGYAWRAGYQDVAQNRAVHTLEAAEMASNVVAADLFLQLDPSVPYPMDWRGEHCYLPPVHWCSSAFSIVSLNRELHMFQYDLERLTEFWLWWLDEAVPASWFLRDLS